MTEIKRAIALGFFDGLHLGHAALLNRTKERAEQERQEEERKKKESGQERAKTWGPEYFNAIARKENGDYAGPWDVAYKGRFVHVLRILEVLPEVVSVEISAAHGETSKIRIPYTTLESWENAEK